MMVVEKTTNTTLGFLSKIEDVKDLSLKFLFEPFVSKHNFIVYCDSKGNHGIASPKKHILREVISHEI